MTADWRRLAACAGMADASFAESDPFFPERSAGHGPKKYAAGKAICGSCLVRTPCLADALAMEAQLSPYRWGVWGDTNPDERRAAS